MPRTKKIDHVSIAVGNPKEALAFFKDVFGATCFEHFTSKAEGYHGYSLRLGDSGLELISPLDGEGFMARFLDRTGGGVHHVTIQVEDMDEVVKTLSERGIEVFGRRDEETHKEAFIHPRQAFGVLVQLLEGEFPIDEPIDG